MCFYKQYIREELATLEKIRKEEENLKIMENQKRVAEVKEMQIYTKVILIPFFWRTK